MTITHQCSASIALVLTLSLAQGEIDPTWQSSTHPDSYSLLYDATVDRDGNAYVLTLLRVGTGPGDTDLGIARINADGSAGWEQRFAGPNGQDVPEAIAMSWDHHAVYALGRSSIPGFANSDYAIVKYDATSGQELWRRFIDGGDLGIDSPSDITPTPDGGIVATGGFDTPNEQRDFGTVKLNADGDLLWSRIWTGQGPFLFENDDSEYVAVDHNGDVVISGNAASFNNTDIMTIKYDGQSGATIWERRYSTTAADAARGIAIADNNDVVILGKDPFGIDHRWLLARYDANTGAEIWLTLIDPGQDDSQRDVCIGPDGHVYATGGTDPDGDDSNANNDLITVSVDGQSGQVRWISSFGDQGNFDSEFGNAIYARADGRIFVAGFTSSDSLVPEPFATRALLLEYDPATGSVVDLALVGTPPGAATDDVFRFMGADAGENLVAVGTALGGAEILAARFDVASPCLPDLNNDGVLDFFDVSTLINTTPDLNDDGVFDFFDISIFVNAFTAGCP